MDLLSSQLCCSRISYIWRDDILLSGNPSLAHIPRQNHNSKRHVHPNAHSSIIYRSKYMETTQMTISRGMDKKDIVYTDNGTLFSYKKNTIMSFSIR